MTESAPFDLLLFTRDVALARRALDAGVDAIVIDWENRGKEIRQKDADTQINFDTPADLSRMREISAARIVVRVNSFFDGTRDEIETALDRGASEILLPMVRNAGEVESALATVHGRAPLGILIETVEAIESARLLGSMPVSRIYVGLNDLAIARQTASIFAPLVDGTLESIRPHIRVPFGFGGLTLPDRGRPVPCRLLMGEMARLGASHSFLRRSFLADTAGENIRDAVVRIRAGLESAKTRTPAEILYDCAELRVAVEQGSAPPVMQKPAHPTDG